MRLDRPGNRRGRTDEQRREDLFGPREPAFVRLLRSRVVVENADRSGGSLARHSEQNCELVYH